MSILHDKRFAVLALLKAIKTEKKAGCEVKNTRDKEFSSGEQCDKHKVCGKMTLPDTLPDHNPCPEKLESYIAN